MSVQAALLRPAARECAEVSDETLRTLTGYQIKRAFSLIQADLLSTLEPFGLRMISFSALVVIVDNPGVRASQLADALAIERPNLVVVIEELERRGLIRRDRMDSDRRAFALAATAEGKELSGVALAAVRRHEEQMLSVLAPTLRGAVREAMGAIRAARE